MLTVVGLGEDIDEARSRAYESIAEIRLDGSFYRHDIAADSFSAATARQVPIFAALARQARHGWW